MEVTLTQNSNLLSISAVHRLTGKARSTIGKHMKSGELSFQLDEKGNKVIEAAEAARVYKIKFDLDDDGQIKLDTKRSEKPNNEDSLSNSTLLEQMKEQRKLLNANIEDLRTNLEKALEREGKQMLLLTNQSEGVDKIKDVVKEELDELRESLAAQRLETKKLKAVLLAERKKSWFQRTFGRRRGHSSS